MIYTNDNFGRWRSDFREAVDHWEKEDYFVLKPKHSGFYATTLDTLLELPGSRIIFNCF